MYCPNCGSENNQNQNYCRFCGFNLTETAKSLKLQRSFGERAYRLSKTDKIKRFINKVTEVLWVGFFLGLIVVFFIDPDRINAFLKFSLAVFSVFQILIIIFNYRQQEKTKTTISKETNSDAFENRKIESKVTQKLLEDKPFEPLSSITENPTELLAAEQKTRKFK